MGGSSNIGGLLMCQGLYKRSASGVRTPESHFFPLVGVSLFHRLISNALNIQTSNGIQNNVPKSNSTKRFINQVNSGLLIIFLD
jgi:hypothetical protein